MLTNVFRRFPGIFIEKTTFEEFVEICEEIRKEEEIQYTNKKEIIDSYLVIIHRRNVLHVSNES